MTCCPAYQPHLLERASASLDPGAGARLDAHLATCPGCRAEAAALDDALALVALPPRGADEREALAGLADSLRQAQRQAERRLSRPLRWSGWVAGAAAAAALVALTLHPPARQSPAVDGAEFLAARPAVEAWQAPDPDELLEAAGYEDEAGDVALVGADGLALAEALADTLEDP